MLTKTETSRMNSFFSVFNGHVNNASERADKEFVSQFGQETFDNEIAPFHESGIMSIFDKAPNIYSSAWVALVTSYVNE